MKICHSMADKIWDPQQAWDPTDTWNYKIKGVFLWQTLRKRERFFPETRKHSPGPEKEKRYRFMIRVESAVSSWERGATACTVGMTPKREWLKHASRQPHRNAQERPCKQATGPGSWVDRNKRQVTHKLWLPAIAPFLLTRSFQNTLLCANLLEH